MIYDQLAQYGVNQLKFVSSSSLLLKNKGGYCEAVRVLNSSWVGKNPTYKYILRVYPL